MAANGIPLHCNICPKKPNFSDVSHLLTHIASKGHLSNYYKIKVRSTHEEASRLLIETYDRWYGQWNVEELMSERMNQKDKRRTRARPAARAAPAPKVEAPVPRPVRRAAIGNFLDPRLGEQQQIIKIEQSVSPPSIPQPTGPILRHRNTYALHMQYWPTESRASSRSYTNPEYDTSSEYSAPSERRRHRHTAVGSCAIEEDPSEAADPMAVSESTKLKGVYWPGMDIFDSATPEMRRKRNQKKDSSVVEQLELNSQEVEATELIFTPHGSFKRQRRISCSESDDEEEIEVKAESPQPKRRRPVLTNIDVNARPSRYLQGTVFPLTSRNHYLDRGRLGYDHAHDDRAPKRRDFDVFQDDDDDFRFTQPVSMKHLTSGFGNPLSPPLAQGFASYRPYIDSFQFDNKENMLPSFNHTAYGTLHDYQGSEYHWPAFAYGSGHDHHGFQGTSHTYNGASAYDHLERDEDDQRTITAPPSPSTS